MKRLGIKSAITAAAVCCFLGSSYAQIVPDGSGGTTYTAGSGLTLTGSAFKLGDANLTYASGRWRRRVWRSAGRRWGRMRWR